MHSLQKKIDLNFLAFISESFFIKRWSEAESFTIFEKFTTSIRVSVQGVKSLGGHFACLCREFDFYEVKNEKKILLFFKKKLEILLHF